MEISLCNESGSYQTKLKDNLQCSYHNTLSNITINAKKKKMQKKIIEAYYPEKGIAFQNR